MEIGLGGRKSNFMHHPPPSLKFHKWILIIFISVRDILTF